jgi:predicted Zn-dependent peptidase
MNKQEYPRLRETVYDETLPNGLKILVASRPGFSAKYAYFATDYGSIDTRFLLDGQTVQTPDGVAHYLEHKMFDMPYGDAMQRFADTGASPNAYTTYDMTAYFFECTDKFEENLRTLLEFVSTPYFTAESVQKEQGIIGQEIRMYEDTPGSRVFENLYAAMYHHHPVKTSIAGTVESIADITPEVLTQCHRAFYDPSNMVLCVAGDVDPERVAQIAAECLPKEPGGVSGRDYGPAEPLRPKETRVEARMEVSMPMFALGFKAEAPAPGEELHRMELLGDLAAELLAGESSPLYNRMYAENLIDASFSVGYDSMKGVAMLAASGDSRDPDAVYAALLEEADRIAREGVDEQLFRQLKKSALGRRIRELDSFSAVCARLAGAYFDGYAFQRFPDLYEQITPQQVADFLRQTVQPERACLSVVLPLKDETL